MLQPRYAILALILALILACVFAVCPAAEAIGSFCPTSLNEDALGAFDREHDLQPGVTRAAFHPEGGVLVLAPGATAPPEGDGADQLLFRNGAAMCVLKDGRVAVVVGDEIQLSAPNDPDEIEATIKVTDAEPLTDVVAIREHGDGFLVVESAAHRIRSIGPDGRERMRLGGKGSGKGEFNFPLDVALDNQGRIFVVDRDNHRIQRLSPEGVFERDWGGRGAFPGLLAAPSSIDIENDQVYVSEELNHRVSVFDLDGRYRYQWGMHSVVPRQGQGRIHYPMSVDVSSDGSRAVVAEPFERRIQFFKLFPGGIAEARQQPMPSKQDIRSHFGPFIAADEDLLAMWEPESGSIVVFDMTTETGINITVFTNHGSGWDDLGRLGALHVDGKEQVIIVSDLVNDRLLRWRLDRDREGTLKYDPFMARLATAVDLQRTRERLESLDPERTWVTPRIVALTRAQVPGAPLLAADEANGVVLALNDKLDPIAIGARSIAPIALVSEGEDVRLIEEAGVGVAVWPLGVDGSARGYPVLLDSEEPVGGALLFGGALYQGNSNNDRIDVFDSEIGRAEVPEEELSQVRAFDASSVNATSFLVPTPDRGWGETGEEDGQFYAPAGMAATGDGRIVVVDRGNHRAQIFAPDGTWLSTFSLSSGYTTPRRKATDE